MKGASVDLISAGGGKLSGSGDVAQRLLKSGFNINSLRTNDVLRKEEWQQFDTALIDVARQRLPLTDFFISNGMQFSISNGLGTTILEWEQISDMEPADVSMAGVTRGEQDTVEFTLNQLPLPIVHKDFTINIRKLEASRTLGQSLDTTQAELAMRLVAEKIEDMIIVGHATRVGTAQIFGLSTHPDILTGAQTGTTGWSVDSTGEQILADAIAMMNDLQTTVSPSGYVNHMYGPYALLVDYAAWNRFMADFKANSDKSILSRLRELEGLGRIIPSSNIAANTCIMLQLTKDVFDEVVGLQPTMVQWESQGGMQTHFKIMAIMVPRVKSTVEGQSGIVRYT